MSELNEFCVDVHLTEEHVTCEQLSRVVEKAIRQEGWELAGVYVEPVLISVDEERTVEVGPPSPLPFFTFPTKPDGAA